MIRTAFRVCCVLALGAFFAPRAAAAPIVSVQSVAVAPGGTSGSFLVRVSVPLADLTPVMLSGFTVDLSVAAVNGAQVVAVGYPAGYLFAGNSFNQSNMIPLNGTVLPGPDVFATDAYDTTFATLAPGATSDLIEVFFTTQPNTGPNNIVVPVALGARTDLNDENLDTFPFTTANGSITLLGAGGAPAPVPGPPPAVVLGGLLAVLAVRVRRDSPPPAHADRCRPSSSIR